jgi:hypothetical protein
LVLSANVTSLRHILSDLVNGPTGTTF